jgi:peptide/nickel transport system permease protein
MTNPLNPVPSGDPDKRDIEAETSRQEHETERPENEHAENAIELKEVEGLSQGRIVLKRFLRHKGAMISLVILLLVIILVFSSIGIDVGIIKTTGWWQWNFTEITPIVNNAAPTIQLWPFSLGSHPFGQDEIGHDAFARVMRGAQQSIMITFVIGIVGTAIGVTIGALAGFYRGKLDSILMRLTDLIIIIPLILLTAIVGKRFQDSGSFVFAIVIGLLIWTGLARLVRGEVLGLREREFVDAARVAGASNMRIIFRHILPNAVGVIIVNTTLTMAAAILLESALSYLGFGVVPPDVSLGRLISEYQTAFNTRPWLFWWPGLFIIVIALTINFIGDGLRDAFDPRQRRKLNRKATAATAAAREKASINA